MPKTKRLPRVGPEGKKMIQRGRVIHPKAKNWTPQNWTWLDSKETLPKREKMLPTERFCVG